MDFNSHYGIKMANKARTEKEPCGCIIHYSVHRGINLQIEREIKKGCLIHELRCDGKIVI